MYSEIFQISFIFLTTAATFSKITTCVKQTQAAGSFSCSVVTLNHLNVKWSFSLCHLTALPPLDNLIILYYIYLCVCVCGVYGNINVCIYCVGPVKTVAALHTQTYKSTADAPAVSLRLLLLCLLPAFIFKSPHFLLILVHPQRFWFPKARKWKRNGGSEGVLPVLLCVRCL